MFSLKKILGVFLCLVIIGLSVSAGCGAKTPAGAVRIGVLLPLSGPTSAYGQQAKLGIEFVLSEIDAAGGIKSLGGAPIEVVWADDEGNPDVSATEMERLMTTENVSAVIGPLLSPQMLSASPLSDKYKIPSIGLAGSPTALAGLNLNYWRTLSIGNTTGAYGTAFADFLKYLIDNYSVTANRIAISMVDNSAGRDQNVGLIQRLDELGLSGHVVLDQMCDPTAATMDSYALIAKAANPDVLLTFPSTANAVKWVQAMYDVDFYPPIVIGGAELLMNSTRAKAGTAIYDSVFSNCALFGTPDLKADVPIASCQAFDQEITAWASANGVSVSFDMEAAHFAAQGMYCLWDALEKAGSAKPEAINNALHQLSIGEADPHFIIPVYGPAVEWLPNGFMKNYTPMVTQYENGTQVIVWPKDIRQAEPSF